MKSPEILGLGGCKSSFFFNELFVDTIGEINAESEMISLI